MGKGITRINNGFVKSKSLALMYRYCPGQPERILRKCSYHSLLNLLSLLIESIFHVLPFHHLNSDAEIIVRTLNNNFIVFKRFHLPYFTVKEKLIPRQI